MTLQHQHTSIYSYEPLYSPRHIRLLQVAGQETSPTFSLVQYELPSDSTTTPFEAVSYTWGNSERVSTLPIEPSAGRIGLTANLTAALPYLIRHSTTKLLFIDQLCINQADFAEKSAQISLMSDIYKRASCVIVWLGLADADSGMCKRWLEAVNKLVPTLQSAKKVSRTSPDFEPSVRRWVLSDTFNSPGTASVWAISIRAFWARPWFRRGWIVQEFLLGEKIIALTGDESFTLEDLVDLFTVLDTDNGVGAEQRSLCPRILMELRSNPFRDPEPLRFLRLMSAVASEFVTQEIGDRLYGFLGFLEDINFVPDYNMSVKHNFTRFAATIAKHYGSLDFLSLWSANLDILLDRTPTEFLDFPSWVPSWTAIPLTAPFRLAVGGIRSLNGDIAYNAAAGRRHSYEGSDDAVSTGCLHVRGCIVDYVEEMSSARMIQFLSTEDAGVTEMINQIQSDIPDLRTWTVLDFVRFLNVAASNGLEPNTTAEAILRVDGKTPTNTPQEDLSTCLSMGRGRKIVRTEKGRLGLAPWIGSRAKDGNARGSAIVVLHGCSVPLVLESVESEKGQWSLIGDCFVDGIMLGEAVTWTKGEAQTFILT